MAQAQVQDWTEVDEVLKATLDVPHECAFARAGAVNALPSYPVPPLTTIRGLLYAALGRPSLLLRGPRKYGSLGKEDAYAEQEFRAEIEETTRIGIRVDDAGERESDLRRRMKVGRTNDPKAFGTYVTQVESLQQPTYTIFVGCVDSDRLAGFADALRDTERLLYLGRSDDLVDIRDVGIHPVERVDDERELPNAVVPGGHGEDVFMLPVAAESFGSHSPAPATTKLVSIGGSVDAFYRVAGDVADNTDKFVFVDGGNIK